MDCFAHVDNAQLPIFYSRFRCPGSAAVDAFTVNWSGNVNWLVPPFHLTSRAVKHAQECRAVGSLLVPVWKSAHFWPICFPMVAIWHLLCVSACFSNTRRGCFCPVGVEVTLETF